MTDLYRDKQVCCCCLVLTYGVLLIGIFGLIFHLGQLVVCLVRYLQSKTEDSNVLYASSEDSYLNHRINKIFVILIHSVGILVNLLAAVGARVGKSLLLLPWILFEGTFSIIVLGFSVYYLALYTFKETSYLLFQSVLLVFLFLVMIYYLYVVIELFRQYRNQDEEKSSEEKIEKTAPPLEIE